MRSFKGRLQTQWHVNDGRCAQSDVLEPHQESRVPPRGKAQGGFSALEVMMTQRAASETPSSAILSLRGNSTMKSAQRMRTASPCSTKGMRCLPRVSRVGRESAQRQGQVMIFKWPSINVTDSLPRLWCTSEQWGSVFYFLTGCAAF